MLKILIIIAAVFALHVFSIDHMRERRIYADIVRIAGENAQKFRLVIVDSLDINAYANGENVYVTQGFIEYTKHSDSQLALVFAHEIGHNIHKHPYQGPRCVYTKFCEYQADEYAKDLMSLQNKYDVCEGAEFFVRIDKTYPGQGGVYDPHPAPLDRAKYFRENCEL